jgi:hypothetical protein
MMIPINDSILKTLTIIYWYTLQLDNWKVASQVMEQQIKYENPLERQSRSSAPSPKAMRLEEMTERQLKDFVASMEKLYPEVKDLAPGLADLDPNLEHPPPASA